MAHGAELSEAAPGLALGGRPRERAGCGVEWAVSTPSVEGTNHAGQGAQARPLGPWAQGPAAPATHWFQGRRLSGGPSRTEHS